MDSEIVHDVLKLDTMNRTRRLRIVQDYHWTNDDMHGPAQRVPSDCLRVLVDDYPPIDQDKYGSLVIRVPNTDIEIQLKPADLEITTSPH